ncbi:MAG TPA: hypothetical protein VEV17_01545 [Bryobacteraceae bacterium]|nr:hypothetical protein [Bryobacteraceae bacterium]
MRSLISAAFFLGLLGTAFGQHQGQYSSLGGFGNVLYPGTGHAPATPVGGINGPRFPGFFNGAVLANPGFAAHPQHRRTVIVPYPVFYGGGYGYGGYGYGYDPSQGYPPGYGDQAPPIVNTNTAPSVVINQNFVPPQANPVVREYGPDTSGDQSSLRMYQVPSSRQLAEAAQGAGAGAATAQRPANDSDQPTLYLIAFKDHNIVQALGYWMEGSTLHYVTVDHSLNQVSLDLIDRDLSQRLNAERNIEFKLPAAR